MSKLNQINKFSKEDFPSDAPKWLDKLLTGINKLLDTIFLQLNRNIDFYNNIDSEVHKAVIDPTFFPYSFTLQKKKTTPFACLLCQCVLSNESTHTAIDVGNVDWLYDDGKVIVYGISGITAGSKYNITFLVL